MPIRLDEILKKGVEALENIKASTPLLDAQLLLCHILNVDRIYLYTYPERILTDEKTDSYFKLIEKRASGIPVQYLIGNQEFMGLDFYVEEGVLIPRADTEILVEEVIRHFKQKDGSMGLNIADIGTGSGAIAISLAKWLPNSTIYAVDISMRALEISKKNAIRHKVSDRIWFFQGDLFKPLKKENIMGKLDGLLSNPPYIPKADIDNLQREVAQYEPRAALDGGEDGLDFYRRIIKDAPLFLKDGALLAFEVGYDQAGPVSKMLELQGGFQNISIKKDLSGIDRVVMAVRNFS